MLSRKDKKCISTAQCVVDVHDVWQGLFAMTQFFDGVFFVCRSLRVPQIWTDDKSGNYSFAFRDTGSYHHSNILSNKAGFTWETEWTNDKLQ